MNGIPIQHTSPTRWLCQDHADERPTHMVAATLSIPALFASLALLCHCRASVPAGRLATAQLRSPDRNTSRAVVPSSPCPPASRCRRAISAWASNRTQSEPGPPGRLLRAAATTASFSMGLNVQVCGWQSQGGMRQRATRRRRHVQWLLIRH